MTVTLCHATEEDKEREEEIDIDKKKKSKKEKGAKAPGADALTTLFFYFFNILFFWVMDSGERMERCVVFIYRNTKEEVDTNV